MSKKQQQQSGGVTIRQLRQIPGTMSCVFEHQTSGTTADFEWRGPKLNEVWPEVLAFFRWTNDTMRSESQVRLFVNVRTQEWKAWAFPQKANTGMTAKELTEGDEGYAKTIEQRAQFPDPDWYYWGTVHHHCNASAFQSGTDQENERSQDGIHITVGNLGSPLFDLHTRLYIDKFKLVFHLCDFWDIGNVFDTLPNYMKRLLKDDAINEMAKMQMCVPPPADQTFPDIWKANVIDCTPKMVVQKPFESSHSNNYDGQVRYALRPLTQRGKANFDMDLRKAAGALMYMVEDPQCTMNTVNDVMNSLRHICSMMDDEMLDMLDIMSKNDVLPENVLNWLEKMQKNGSSLEIGDTKGPATQQQILGHQPNYGDSHGWEGMGG